MVLMFDWLFKRTQTYKDLVYRVLSLEKKVAHLFGVLNDNKKEDPGSYGGVPYPDINSTDASREFSGDGGVYKCSVKGIEKL